MKLILFLLWVGLENPFFGNIQSTGPTCPNSTVRLQISARNGEIYQWEWRPDNQESWRTFQNPVTLSATELLTIDWPTQLLPAEIRVKSWRNDSVWYSSSFFLDKPVLYQPTVEGALRVCTGQDARLRVDFPPQGTFQWERWSQGQFVALTETSKFTRTKQAEMIIRGTAGLDDQSVFRCRWTSPDGCVHFSLPHTLSVNQLSTISPTPSALICQNQPQPLRTAGIQGEWLRNEWSFSDSLGVLRLQADSSGRTYQVPAWPLHLRNIQVRGWFQTRQKSGSDTLLGTCTLTTTRTYTVTAAPVAPSDSLIVQCGLASMALQPKGGDWSLQKNGPWLTTSDWIHFQEPDTVTRWFRVRSSAGCPSAPYTVTYRALEVPKNELKLAKDFQCSNEITQFWPFAAADSTNYWFRWKSSGIWKNQLTESASSDWLFWQKRDTLTGCSSATDSVFIRSIPKLESWVDLPKDPVCPGEIVSLMGYASDPAATWSWEGLGTPSVERAIQKAFFENTTGKVIVRNVCEKIEMPWEVKVLPPIGVRLSSAGDQTACVGDSTEWRVQSSAPVMITWFDQKLGKIGTGAHLVRQTEVAGRNQIWFQWVDACGRMGQSDTLVWTVHPTPALPTVLDSLQLCEGTPLPNFPTGADRWVWTSSKPLEIGESFWMVRTENEWGCQSTPKTVWVGVSPRFDFRLVQTQEWVCVTGLNSRRVFIQNPSSFPIQWLSKGVQTWELGGWVVSQAGQFIATQQRGWCTMSDTVVVQAREVIPWREIPTSTVFYCPSSAPLISLPLEDSASIYWYETAMQNVPVHVGNALLRTSGAPIWVRKRAMFGGEAYCESEAIEITPTPSLGVKSLTLVQDRCRGNSATFEVTTQGAGMGQWFQKKRGDSSFVALAGATSPQLRLTNVGSSSHPDQSIYRFLWRNETCSAWSEEMKLTVLGYQQSLSSQEVCAGSDFPLKIPPVQGTLVSWEWQTRPGTSGAWVTQSPPVFVEPRSQYWRLRGQFQMENGQTCTQTSDDARVQVHTARGNLRITADPCPGQASHFSWAPQTVGGIFTQNGQPIGALSGRLPGGTFVFTHTIKNCVWDTTISIVLKPHVLSAPELPAFNRYFLGDSAQWSSILAHKELRWFADSLGARPVSRPLLEVVGPFQWFARYEVEGCGGPMAVWRGEILQPLQVTTPKTYVHQCAGLSLDLIVEAKGQGTLSYQWFQAPDSTGEWTALTSWTSRHRGEQTSTLRLYSIGSFPHLDRSWYRCLIRDEFGEHWSEPIRLQTWLARGALLPHQYVCEGSSPVLDIRAFRGWRNNESAAYWERRAPEGWEKWKEGYQLVLQAEPEGEYRYAWEFINSDQETCRHVSDSFRIQKVQRPTPPTENSWAYCQEERTIALPLSGSQFSWYTSLDQERITSTATPRISLHAPQELTWWVARKGTYCESERIPVRIQIHPRPQAPLSTTPPLSVGYELEFSATGDQLRWYRTTRSGSQMEAPRFTQPGLHRFYVTQTNAWGCESPQQLIESRLTWPASIGQQPQNLFECGGNVATFQVRMQGSGDFTYQWYQSKGSDEFLPLTGANSMDLRINAAGSADFPDSSRYFCEIRWGDGKRELSDTVSLWINSVASRPSAQTICSTEVPFALDPSMVAAKGNIRQFIWELKSGDQWIQRTGMTWPIDSFPSGRHTVRARIIFQSEIRETCTRSSGEFTVTTLPAWKDETLPDRLVSCDTAQRPPLLVNWEWQKIDTLHFIRSKGVSGCWSEWSPLEWEKQPCWTQELTCETSEIQPLERNWNLFRLSNGLVWAKARGEGTIFHGGSFESNPHWVIQGQGELAAPPLVPTNARWIVTSPLKNCSNETKIWEALTFLSEQPTWPTDTSISISWKALPPSPEFSGVPFVQEGKFGWENHPPTQWQRWDESLNRWEDISFPQDTVHLTAVYRYRHWFNSQVFEWKKTPSLTWASIPTYCRFKGVPHFDHNLHFPLQTDLRTPNGQLLQSFSWTDPNHPWPIEIRSMDGPMKIITFTDRWGRTCTVRQWWD